MIKMITMKGSAECNTKNKGFDVSCPGFVLWLGWGEVEQSLHLSELWAPCWKINIIPILQGS